MSIVRINAITVPDGRGDALEERFANRAREVEKVDGFEGFELLRPTQGNVYYVYTRWRDEAAFDAWVSSDAFTRGHAQARPEGAPVSHGAELLAFEVVLSVTAPG